MMAFACRLICPKGMRVNMRWTITCIELDPPCVGLLLSFLVCTLNCCAYENVWLAVGLVSRFVTERFKLLIIFTSSPNAEWISFIHCVWTLDGLILSIILLSEGAKENQIVLSTNSWSFDKFQYPIGGVATEDTSSVSISVVGSRPTLEIETDCVVIV
jgi:hypothetical protein